MTVTGEKRAAERSRQRMNTTGNPAEPATIRRTAAAFHRKAGAGYRRAVGPAPGTFPSAADNERAARFRGRTSKRELMMSEQMVREAVGVFQDASDIRPSHRWLGRLA